MDVDCPYSYDCTHKNWQLSSFDDGVIMDGCLWCHQTCESVGTMDYVTTSDSSPNVERVAVEQLKRYREQRGLSYQQMASKMREHGSAISGQALHRTEKGDPPRRLTIDDLVAASHVLGVPITRLVAPPSSSELWALRTELGYCEVSMLNAFSSMGDDYAERMRLVARLEELLSSDVSPTVGRLGELQQARHHLSPGRDLGADSFHEPSGDEPVAFAEFRERRDAVLPELDRLIAELEAESGD